jgi:serpin B
MKKILTLMILFSIILISACQSIPQETEIMPTEEQEPMEETQETPPPSQESGMVKSSVVRETSPEVTPDQLSVLVQDNTQFGMKFFELIRTDGENVIFSPISISLALSMTLAGAESSTEQAMREALQLSLLKEEIHPAFNALLLDIEKSQEDLPEDSEGSKFQLNIANSIWAQAGYDFKEIFMDTLARHYGAGIYNVNFMQDPESARLAINDWIEEETEEKIKDLIPPGAINTLTRLVLANAIYFNGSWRYPFNESATTQAPFKLLDGSESNVDMMTLSGESLLYTKGENYQAVQLPYLSPDFVMTILVPDENAFLDFESSMDIEKFGNILNELSFRPVNLQMPKFDFTTSVNAKDPLSKLGMEEAFFADSADFSGITDLEKLYISDVLHKATITVDEQGTEAAAATVVIMRAESMPAEPISLIIDRPFLFFIRHESSGTILFMGHVVEP